MNQNFGFGVLAALSLFASATPAAAHVSVTSGPGFADQTQIVRFGVGHGCENHDTRSVRIEIPPEVFTVRAISSDFGPASVELDDAGLVRFVSWEKPEASLLESDTNYYEVALRLKVPNRPFTTLHFSTLQVCEAADGTELEVEWFSTEESEGEEGPEPAPALTILPKRLPGWNQFTVPAPIEDLSDFFGDALIVWKDDAAFSVNPATVEMIAETDGVSSLAALEAGDVVWVKY